MANKLLVSWISKLRPSAGNIEQGQNAGRVFGDPEFPASLMILCFGFLECWLPLDIMHRFNMLSLSQFLVIGALLGGRVEAADNTRPNVLMILTDDQGKLERESCVGSCSLTKKDKLMNSMDYMPNVQRLLGDNGVTSHKHYCTSAFCCPSRVSLFTGKCVQ